MRDLPLNGVAYHLGITAEQLAPATIHVGDPERAAFVALEEIGFSRVQEVGTLLSDRFYKMVDTSNGSPAIGSAGLERASDGNSVCVHIS